MLPLRQIIFDQSKLQASAMLIDVFSLLTEARQRIGANVNSIEAKRNFWLAYTNLGVAMLGGGSLNREADTVIAGLLIVGLAVMTSKPFQEATYTQVVQETASEAAHEPSKSGDEAPSKVADQKPAEALDESSEVADATPSEPADEPPSEVTATGQAEAEAEATGATRRLERPRPSSGPTHDFACIARPSAGRWLCGTAPSNALP